MRSITEQTLIPLSLAAGLIGAALWAASIKSDIRVTSENLDHFERQALERFVKLEAHQEEYNSFIHRIDERLSRIEGKLGINLDEH